MWTYNNIYNSPDELYHYGVKGMKWGIRRTRSTSDETDQKNSKRGLTKGQKTAIKVGVAVVGTALAAYGTYKLGNYIKAEAWKKVAGEGQKL